MRCIMLMTCLSVLAGCADETVSGYAQPDAVYRLTELDGAPFAASATLRFPSKGQVEGRGPCNSFSGAQSTVYPWFEVQRLVTTRRACPDLAEEQAMLAALQSMTFVEVSGPVMILSNSAGGEMVYRAGPP